MIGETTARASYTANGSITDFSFLFEIYSKNDIEVLLNGSVQQLDTDYQVRADSGLFSALASSSLPAAGSIRFIDANGVAEAPDSGAVITILRKQSAVQSSDYIAGQSFPAASVERDIDKLMMAIQQTRETLARALTFAKKSSLTNGVVDDPTVGYFARAKVGGGIDWAQVVSAGEITVPVPVNQGGTGSATAADARAALDVPSTGEAILDALLGAKGDLIVATAADTPARLAVGAAGTVLVSKPSAAEGVTWEVAGFTTGDVKLTLKTAADTGWVLMNDTTIGDASSGATGRANADTEALFTLLWTNTADADCAVSSGRGASAAADYAAHKTIALPKALGRALACYGSGSGLTARALAKALGSENAINVTHTHTVTDPGHLHRETTAAQPSGATQGTGAGSSPGIDVGYASGVDSDTGTPRNTLSNTTGITIANSGSSGTGANMQPTVFMNVMIKL